MNRWVRLWSAFVGMVMIGNLQYAWTLFAEPMVKAHAGQDGQWGGRPVVKWRMRGTVTRIQRGRMRLASQRRRRLDGGSGGRCQRRFLTTLLHGTCILP